MRMEVVRTAVHTKKQSGIFLKERGKEKFSLLNEKRRRKGRKKSRCSR